MYIIPLGWGWGDTLIEALRLMIRFCESEAAKNLELAAKFLRDPSIQNVEAPELYWHNVKLAQKWGEKRAVLVEAAAKLKQL